jgi:hypothetical protein
LQAFVKSVRGSGRFRRGSDFVLRPHGVSGSKDYEGKRSVTPAASWRSRHLEARGKALSFKFLGRSIHSEAIDIFFTNYRQRVVSGAQITFRLDLEGTFLVSLRLKWDEACV